MKGGLAFYLFTLALSALCFLIFSGFSVNEFLEIKHFKNSFSLTEGTVTNINKGIHEFDSVNIVEIAFYVNGSKLVSETYLKFSEGFRSIPNRVGDRISIYYSKDNPIIIRINSFKVVYSSLYNYVMFSLTCLIVAVLSFRYRDWMKKQDGSYWPYG